MGIRTEHVFAMCKTATVSNGYSLEAMAVLLYYTILSLTCMENKKGLKINSKIKWLKNRDSLAGIWFSLE